MPKEEWGTKRVCPNCETRFYDLRRDPMVCPACGHSFDLASLQGGKNQSVPPTKQKSPASPAVAADDDSAEVIEDDADVEITGRCVGQRSVPFEAVGGSTGGARRAESRLVRTADRAVPDEHPCPSGDRPADEPAALVARAALALGEAHGDPGTS